MADALRVGDMAPEFELMDQDKTKVKLSDFRGKKNVMLLFYPMDFSPTCTVEHCTFGPELPRIAPGSETVVFGVSCDSPYTHAVFRKQYNIPYALLSDPTRKMAKAYGMWAGEELGFLWPIGGEFFGGLEIGDVDDQRICGRASFRLEDFFNRCGIGRISAQAIDGFGGEGDEAALFENFGRFGNVVAHASSCLVSQA